MMFNHRLTLLGIIGVVLLILCLAGVLLMSAAGWLLAKETETTMAGYVASPAEISANQLGMGVVPRGTPTKLSLPTMIQSRSVSTPTPLPRPGPIITSTLLVTSAAESTSLSEASSAPISDTTLMPSMTPTPTATPVIIAGPVQENMATRLVIPKLDLDVAVLAAPIKNQTWQVDHLGQTIGHLEGTAPPGGSSNMVLAGHVTLAAGVPGPFIALNQLAPGDFVIVYQGDTAFQYVVDTHYVVDRTAVDVAYPSEVGQVTLITCTTWSSEQGRYQNRLVVKARLVGN